MKAGLTEHLACSPAEQSARIITVLIVLLAAPVFALAAHAAEGNGAEESKIHITADRLISRQAERFAEFSGNVRATQDDMVIVSDSLQIYFRDNQDVSQDDGNREEDSIERLIATGNVRIDHENLSARCDQAVYTAADGLLVLTGETVTVKDEGGTITGKRMVFERETGEITITGEAGSRVEAVFDQQGDRILPTERE